MAFGAMRIEARGSSLFVPRLVIGWVQAALGKGVSLSEAAPFGGGNHLRYQPPTLPAAGG